MVGHGEIIYKQNSQGAVSVGLYEKGHNKHLAFKYLYLVYNSYKEHATKRYPSTRMESRSEGSYKLQLSKGNEHHTSENFKGINTHHYSWLQPCVVFKTTSRLPHTTRRSKTLNPQ